MPETARTTRASVDEASTTRRVETLLRRLVLLGAPLAMFLASLWHPESGHHGPGASFLPAADTYLAVHLVLVPAVALLAVGLYSLVADARGPVALLARVATAVFGFTVTVYSSMAGLAVGVLGTQAPAGTDTATLAPVVDSLFVTGLPVVLVLLALSSYFVATVTISVVLYRAGAPLPALLALVGSTVAIYDHLGILAVVGAGLYLVAVVWLEFGWTADAPGGQLEQSAAR